MRSLCALLELLFLVFTRGLIGEDDIGVVGECARNRYTLPLTARKMKDSAVCLLVKSDAVEQLYLRAFLIMYI